MDRKPWWKRGKSLFRSKKKPNSPITTASSPRQSAPQPPVADVKSHGPARPPTVTVQQAPSTPPPTTPDHLTSQTSTTTPVPRQSEVEFSNSDELPLPGRVWVKAYNCVDPKLVRAYEDVLRQELGDGEPSSNNHAESERDGRNQPDPEQARTKMSKLVESGLSRTERVAVVTQGIHEGMRVVSSVKELVGRAAKHAPEASAAWVGVCLLLDVLENPTAESIELRDGVSYVISRMDWYWHLSELLLEKNKAETAAIQDKLLGQAASRPSPR